MSRPPSEADKAWRDSASRGEMSWLKDTTFVAADYFQPPRNSQPHAWERIAVPPVNSSHGSGRIYKRVPGTSVDTKYNMVAAELDSQGFDGRKRAKMTNHKSVWGLHSFDPRYEAASTTQQDIARARDQVKAAYKQIAIDNQAIRKNAPPTKRSKYDPSRLTWAPRKRHNSRWPITPPTWETMIAECQPLIVFEIDIFEIDEPAFWDQFAAEQQSKQVRVKQSKKRSKKRRSAVQATPLSPISEEHKEPSGVPAKYRPMYKAPATRWAAAADKYFTMSATSARVANDDGEGDKDSVVITNHRGHFRVPSSPLSSRSSTTTTAKPHAQDPDNAANERGCFRVPSSPLSSSTSTNAAAKCDAQDPDDGFNERGCFRVPSPSSSGSSTTVAIDRKRKAQNERIDQRAAVRRRSSQYAADPAAVAVFDQPTSQMLAEPEHETKRRVSLDNARRSDRQLQMTALKKVRTWVTTTFSGRRRSYAEAMDEQDGQDEPPRTKRRHTLDVDVGRNPDIFGQTAGQTAPKTKFGDLADIKATFAAQEDSLSDVPSEFSMARKAFYSRTATKPRASATLPAFRRAFINWDAIPNIDDMIRDLLDRKADRVFGKTDDSDSILSDDTQPFDESVYSRIQSVLQPDEDDDMTTGDLDVGPIAPNPPAPAPRTADSPVPDSASDDSTVPDSPTPDVPTAMETTVEPAYIMPNPDVPLPSIEHDDSSSATAESATVESPTVRSAAMIDTPISNELAATLQAAGASDGDSHAASGQNSDAATPDEPMADVDLVEQPTVMPQPADMAEDQPDEGLAPEPTSQPQTVEAQDADDDSRFDVLHNFLRRAHLRLKAAWSSGSPKAPPSDAQPPNDPQPPNVPQPPNDPQPQADLFAAPKSPRKALAPKDSNMSPITSKTNMSDSPGKKRKLKEAEETPFDMTKTSRLVKPDLDDTTPQPLRKRRRKGAENDAPDEIFNPEMSLSHSLTQRGSSGGPRRSKRVATPRSTEPSAPSHIPVRLPGSFDADMPAVSTTALMQQKMEKDLAALTRTNTRRNKGPALPVSARLAGLSLPAGAADPFVSPVKASGHRPPRPAKGVRWAETLARYQGDDDSASPVTTAAAAASRDDTPLAAAPTVVERPSSPLASAAAQPPIPHVVPAPPPASLFASVPAESEKKKALRPRPSRLPAAVTKTTTPTPTPTPTPATTTTPNKAPQTPRTPKPKASSAAPPRSRITPTPTRRSSSVGARLGTPAAKRRGSAKK